MKKWDKLSPIRSFIFLHFQNISIAHITSDMGYHSGYLPTSEGPNRNITSEIDGGWAGVILALKRAL